MTKPANLSESAAVSAFIDNVNRFASNLGKATTTGLAANPGLNTPAVTAAELESLAPGIVAKLQAAVTALS